MTGRGFGRDITRLITVLFFCLTLITRKIYILFRLQMRRLRMLYAYCTENVWKDPRNVWYVRLLKIVNLSVKSFFDKNIQTLASSLTYTTLLAIIPLLSLLLAIAKGFGFQDFVTHELYRIFPAQSIMLDNSLSFVDKFLSTLSHGVFVGIGIVFLLWTLVSLLRKIEVAYNRVWDIRKGRSIYRILTDYTAILLIIPILMICSGGLSIYLSKTVQDMTHSSLSILSPFVKFLLDLSPVLLLALVFVGMNTLIPYTKVKVRYALLPAVVCSLLFYLIQYVFVSGQISVTRYNAVYGGFAFLPLFLIWMHLSWTVCIASAVMTYSSQNFFRFNYLKLVSGASVKYLDKVALYVVAVIVSRFDRGEKPFGKNDIANREGLPVKLVSVVVDKMVQGEILSMTLDDGGNVLYQPAMNLSNLTVAQFMDRYHRIGYSDFVDDSDVRNKLSGMERLLDPDKETYRQMLIGSIISEAVTGRQQ